MWKSRRELFNEYLLAKIGVDTAENEPCEVRKFELSEMLNLNFEISKLLFATQHTFGALPHLLILARWCRRPVPRRLVVRAFGGDFSVLTQEVFNCRRREGHEPEVAQVLEHVRVLALL